MLHRQLVLALALLLTACSDHGPTASTPVQQASAAKSAPAAVQPTVQAAPQSTTVTLQRLDGSQRPYTVPPEFIEDGAPWYVLTVDGIRYEQDGTIWRERTTQEMADKAVRDKKALRGPFGP